MMMARRGLALNAPSLGSEMDTQPRQPQQGQPQHQPHPAVHTTVTTTAHPLPASKLAMRRRHKASPPLLSIPCADIPNDEDTSEECLTPECLDALFEAAALSNMSSPTTSDVSDVSDVSNVHDFSIDEEELELERAFLRSSSPLATSSEPAITSSMSIGTPGISPRSACCPKDPASRVRQKQHRPRSSNGTHLLERRLLSTSSPSLRTPVKRDPQAQRHPQRQHSTSIVSIACRQSSQ